MRASLILYILCSLKESKLLQEWKNFYEKMRRLGTPSQCTLGWDLQLISQRLKLRLIRIKQHCLRRHLSSGETRRLSHSLTRPVIRLLRCVLLIRKLDRNPHCLNQCLLSLPDLIRKKDISCPT